MCYFLSTHPHASIGAQALINELKVAYGPNGPALSADIISSPAGKKRGCCAGSCPLTLPAASTDICAGFEDDRRLARAGQRNADLEWS
jgi:hypothetical protein